MRAATVDQTRFHGTKAKGISMCCANLAGAKFEECDLTEADVSESTGNGVSFEGCILNGAVLNHADISGCILDDAQMEGCEMIKSCMVEENKTKEKFNC